MGKTTRVVVCGLRSVGKTAILEQLIYGNVTKTAELHSTIEDIYVANIETDRGTREKVRFYDTAGLDYSNPASREQSQLARQYIGLADGYVLVYDTDRPESLDVLVSLKKDIDRNRDKKETMHEKCQICGIYTDSEEGWQHGILFHHFPVTFAESGWTLWGRTVAAASSEAAEKPHCVFEALLSLQLSRTPIKDAV
ncbi:NF-kappa-B inhibitor-interacting Ras-like protein 2 isoform X2 [Anabrus simplex]|uniref:NF-kappa-B inhibitor-interacting Ras-like protein 2 isoform X2 n=1 Tax=Anabrus simplex TaxID=316456 RepID=UPI0035A31662